MIDTHCHLTHTKLCDELDAVIERAREAGVDACITIGTGVEDAHRVLDAVNRHPGYLFGTAGLDPFSCHRAGDRFEVEFERLADLVAGSALCAVGEIGLDYHYDLDPKPIQRERFERQLVLALQQELPVVIHVRDAHDDMLDVLAAYPENRGVIHSFTAGPREAERYLELDWHLSFNGVMTFKNADEIRDAARIVPSNRLLIETDSPYLAPVPLRGRRCEPAYVAHTLQTLATVRDESIESVSAATDLNARRLFSLPG